MNTAFYIFGNIRLKEISILSSFEQIQENIIAGSAFSARLGSSAVAFILGQNPQCEKVFESENGGKDRSKAGYFEQLLCGLPEAAILIQRCLHSWFSDSYFPQFTIFFVSFCSFSKILQLPDAR